MLDTARRGNYLRQRKAWKDVSTYSRGSDAEMKNLQEIKRELVDTLAPQQKEHLDSIRWLYNQQRGAGKTYLLCVEALLQVCESGRGFMIDHFPYSTDHPYVKHMLLGIASKAGLRIKIKELRRQVYEITYDPLPEQVEYSNPNLR